MAKKLAFAPAQRQKLAERGLRAEQITELENALPKISAYRSRFKDPSVTSVRRLVERITRPLRQAHHAMSMLSDAAFPADHAHGTDINRLVGGHFRADETRMLPRLSELEAYDLLEPGGGEPGIRRPLEELDRLAEKIEARLKALGQRRKAASYRPVEIILRALQEGWAKHLVSASKGRIQPNAIYRPLIVSAGNGPFMAVAKICYSAAGITHSPAAAIGAFLQMEQRSAIRRSARDGTPSPPPRKRGRPSGK